MENWLLTPLLCSSQAVIRDGARCGHNMLKDRNVQWTGPLITVQTTWNSTGQSLNRLVCARKTWPPDYSGLLEGFQKLWHTVSYVNKFSKDCLHIRIPAKSWSNGQQTIHWELKTLQTCMALSPGYSKPSGLVKESLCSKDPAGGKEEKNPHQPTSNDLILK